MKAVIFMLLLSASTILFAQEETLTNESVLDMIEFGFSEDVIVAKIQASKTNFITTIESIKELKNKGVSDTLLKTMINGNQKSVQTIRESSQVESRTGIYTKINGELTKILPTVFSGTKTNTLATAFTYGIADATMKSTLNGSSSRNIIPYIKPEFIFYFTNSSNNAFSVGASNWWFASAASPNEFSLVRLTSTGKKRELQTGKVNIYAGTNIGVDENNVIRFDIIQINDYTFKAIPKNALEPGEYCFIYQGSIPSGGFTNQSVFDFSIPHNSKVDDGNMELGQIDGVKCRIASKHNNGLIICTSEKLTTDQIKKAQLTFSLKGKIMFNLEDQEGKGNAYAGIDGDYIILYKENVFIKL